MIDHDRIFKELIKTFFVEFLELFFPEIHAELDVGSIEFLDKQVFTDVTEGEKHEADLVVKARLHGQESFFLFHVEAESQGKEPRRGNFKRRMFVYFARLHEDSGLPVYPIAVLSYDSPLAPAESEYRVEFPGFDVLKFNFRVIQVNRLKWRDFLKHENPVAAALMSKMRMTNEEHRQVKYECLRLMLTLKLDPAKMQIIAGFVNTYLRLEPEEELWVESEIKKLDPTGEKIMQTMTYWEERGLQQGTQQEALSLALRLLKSKFGKQFESALEDRVKRLSVSELEELCVTTLRFDQLSDLTQWLDSTEKRQSDS